MTHGHEMLRASAVSCLLDMQAPRIAPRRPVFMPPGHAGAADSRGHGPAEGTSLAPVLPPAPRRLTPYDRSARGITDAADPACPRWGRVEVIAVIAGSVVAVVWTITTITSAQASRQIGAPSTVAGVTFVGLFATIPLLATAPLPTSADTDQLPWLLLAGGGNIIGLLAIYGAMARGKVSIVAPIASTEGAIAATIAILAGEAATAVLLVALSVVVTGIVLTAYGPEGDDPTDTSSVGSTGPPRRGGPVFLAMAISGALLFGASLYAVGHASGVVPAPWIVASGRIFGVLVIGLPMVLTRRLRMTREALPFVVLCGILEVVGFLVITWGAQDSIAITSVLSAQFAVLVAIVSRLRGERLERHQLLGVVLTGLGVAAVALVQL